MKGGNAMKTYSNFYKSVKTHQNSFFIGANTKNGFRYADSTFLNENNLTKLYIIKGGPGTGKSSLMKRLRDDLEASGISACSYYCSSDPDSLDAVVFENGNVRVAIADGTAPHILDAALPGAVSETVDLGKFWNSDALEKSLNDIARHAALKALAFDKTRMYMASSTELFSLMTCSAREGYLSEKAENAAIRIAKELPHQRKAQIIRNVCTAAVSMKGAVRLTAFENAEKLIGIEDFASLSPLFLETLSNVLIKKGHSIAVSRSPLGEIYELYLPEADVAFIPVREGVQYCKILRMRRFAESEYFSRRAAKRHFNEKCLTELLDGALSALEEAKEHHFAIEEIYSKAMDFSMFDTLYASLLQNSKKRLGVL